MIRFFVRNAVVFSRKRYFFFVGILFAASVIKVSAQEKLFPLYENTELEQLNQPAHKIPKSFNKTQTVLSLPFYDDFSRYTGYPNDSLWMDNDVYINTGYPVKPPTTGVATFDGLNSYGRAYDLGNQYLDGPADTLTSAYIDLLPYTPTDSIYLSFAYQPQGLGEAPDPGDSLMLEFKPDSVPIAFDTTGLIPTKWSSSVWVKMWAVPGASLTPFRVVMIPLKSLTDTNFFQHKFQFRFRAYANNSGNLDIWNVDDVYLDRGRILADSTFSDLAIYQPSLSLINGYSSIPWNYYTANKSSYYTDSIHIFTHNNDVNTKHVTFSYNIQSLPDNFVVANKTSTQVANVDAQQFLDFSLPADPLNPSYVPKNPDSVVLSVQTIALANVPDGIVQFYPNDTATHLQIFNTYLAYDDGTAETGYGITNSPNGSQVALRFDIPASDTLYGIGIHFNQSLLDVSNSLISLRAWSSIDTANKTNIMDHIIAEWQNIKPQYTRQRNGFYYFPLDTPRAVSKSFFLGWSQSYDFLLNVGFDRNYHLDDFSKQSKLFYFVNGGWYRSSQQGVPMIRAYIGKRPVNTGISNYDQTESFKADVYPNPNKGSFNLSLPEFGSFDLELMDMNGKVLETDNNIRGENQIHANRYHPGVYILKITDPDTNNRVFKKVVIY